MVEDCVHTVDSGNVLEKVVTELEFVAEASRSGSFPLELYVLRS